MVKNIIVIGASAGGYKAVTKLVSKIPQGLPVAIFIVIHLAKNSSASVLKNHLEKHTGYICHLPSDQETILPGYIYLAQPDVHMLIKPGTIRMVKGAKENRWRPSIDVLFRSAAAAYDSKVTGIILTGMMDDGTSGMSAIKRSGGICIVQEPSEAEFTDMPVNVLNNVKVDHRVPVDDMGYILDDILSKPTEHKSIPAEVKIETEITERMVSSIAEMDRLGEHSNYTCPDCGGNLWEVKNEPQPRYRCHTGHTYTEKLLLQLQTENIEESLWVSIRMLEERRNLLKNMAGDIGSMDAIRERHLRRSEELDSHIEHLKSLLVVLSQKDLE